MSFDAARLYGLLPSVVRSRDAEQGGPLEALSRLVAEQVALLEEDLERLYDDQFIETCADWVVPYLGDLVGWQPLHPVAGTPAAPRAEVANTIAYRRRKGTAAALEQLAADVTDWPARVVEYFERLATTQYVNHPRPHNRVTPELRRGMAPADVGGAFDTLPRTADVRDIGRGGRYTIPHVGIHLWRIAAWPASAWPAARVDARRYRANPLGADQPLYNRPVTEPLITHLAEPRNVPRPLDLRALKADLAAQYGEERSLWLQVGGAVIDVADIRICDLADDGAGWAHAPPPGTYAIDPERGRIYLPAPVDAGVPVALGCHYGFAAAIGGGEYERETSFATGLAVTRALGGGAALQPALDAARGGGVVELRDSAVFAADATLRTDPEARLELRSANRRRAVLQVGGGELRVAGGRDSEVHLNGVVITGGPLVVGAAAGDGLQRLVLRHCTLVPGRALRPDGEPAQPDGPALVIARPDLAVEIEDCIVGAIRAVAGARVTVRDSIIDATAPERAAYAGLDGEAAGAALSLENCTVIGKLHTAALQLASNTLFVAALGPADNWPSPVISAQRQAGCTRFCLLPPAARVPRPHRCQPATAVAAALVAAKRQTPPPPDALLADLARVVAARVTPVFVSRRYGRPGYGLLRASTDPALLAGADNESEIGAFNRLHHSQRLANLRVRLDEYLRYGLSAGVFFEDE